MHPRSARRGSAGPANGRESAAAKSWAASSLLLLQKRWAECPSDLYEAGNQVRVLSVEPVLFQPASTWNNKNHRVAIDQPEIDGGTDSHGQLSRAPKYLVEYKVILFHDQLLKGFVRKCRHRYARRVVPQIFRECIQPGCLCGFPLFGVSCLLFASLLTSGVTAETGDSNLFLITYLIFNGPLIRHECIRVRKTTVSWVVAKHLYCLVGFFDESDDVRKKRGKFAQTLGRQRFSNFLNPKSDLLSKLR